MKFVEHLRYKNVNASDVIINVRDVKREPNGYLLKVFFENVHGVELGISEQPSLIPSSIKEVFIHDNKANDWYVYDASEHFGTYKS